MIIDKYNTLVMEHCSHPGNIGDSCAETSRYQHLLNILGEFGPKLDLNAFVTESGFVRHPTAPEKDDNGDSWRETDFSGDQALPLFLAADNQLRSKLFYSLKKAGWRTGNGDLMAPIFLGLVTQKKWLVNLCIVGQALLFKLPWRWSDRYNRFEEMKDSSADYLNFIHASIYASSWARKLVLKSTLKRKVADYYAVEQNSEFLIAAYERVIDEYWS